MAKLSITCTSYGKMASGRKEQLLRALGFDVDNIELVEKGWELCGTYFEDEPTVRTSPLIKGRLYRIYHKEVPTYLVRKYSGDNQWLRENSLLKQASSTEELKRHGWEFDSIDLIPLSLGTSIEMLLNLKPSLFQLRETEGN